MVGDPEVILGCVWVTTLLRLTLFVLFLRPGFTKYAATGPFGVLWPTLPSNRPESSLLINIVDCSTNVVCFGLTSSKFSN